MGGLFSGGESVKQPPPPVPEPPPVVTDTGVEDAEKKRLRRRSGRSKTFITGDLIPNTEKKTVLG